MFCFRKALLFVAPFALLVDAGAQHAIVSARVPGRFLVAYRNSVIPADAADQVAQTGKKMVARHEGLGIAVVDVSGPRGAMESGEDDRARGMLARLPGVASVVQDRVVTAHLPMVRPVPVVPVRKVGVTLAVPILMDDLLYTASPQDWAVKAVGGYGKGVAGGTVAGAWNVTTGTGVRIAILDSGVDAAHPDIQPNLAVNLSLVDQTALPSACDDGTPQDQTGHGTFAASLAAGAMGPGTGQMVGVAPTATLLNIKVLERMPGTGATVAEQCGAGQASGLLSWVLAGINEAVTQRADVISLSLGSIVDLTTGDGAGLKAMFDSVTHAAANAGVIVIAAAGNDGMDLSSGRYVELPAQARDVVAMVATTNPACAQNLAAGAVCAAGQATLAYYSNFGAPLNALAAPGGSYPVGDDAGISGWVRGACSVGLAGTQTGMPDGGHSFGCFNLGHVQYVQATGTSASAPLAAGVAALYRAANPGWSAAQVVAAMRAGAVAGLAGAMVSAAPIHP